MAKLTGAEVGLSALTRTDSAELSSLGDQNVLAHLAKANSQSMYSIAVCSGGGLALSIIRFLMLWKREAIE